MPTWYPPRDILTVTSYGLLGTYTVLANEKSTRGNQMINIRTNSSRPPTPYLITAFFLTPRGVGYFCNSSIVKCIEHLTKRYSNNNWGLNFCCYCRVTSNSEFWSVQRSFFKTALVIQVILTIGGRTGRRQKIQNRYKMMSLCHFWQ